MKHVLSILPLLLVPLLLRAQTPPVLPPGGLIQLQVAQPGVDVSSPVTATAEFDPPVTHPGDKVFYRVTLDTTESSVFWPDKIPAPDALKLGNKSSGQITQMLADKFRSLVSFVYEMHATKEGRFSIPAFNVDVSGAEVTVPAATLEVVPKNVNAPVARQLILEASETNVYLGQPFHVLVILPPDSANAVEAMREIEFHGEGLITDKTAAMQAIEPVNLNGQLRTSFVSEMVVTPIAAGPLTFSVQGFTAGREFTAPISIRGQVSLAGGQPKYVLLLSDTVQINVRPLPTDSELPGFTGAIGKFLQDPPRLSTTHLSVGEPVQLKLTFHGEGDLSRFVPPDAPHSRDWQIIADPPPATTFTLIPLTDDIKETPAIPFSYFNPQLGTYVDLTVPSLPITVTGPPLPAEVKVTGDEGKPQSPVKLTDMAATPGITVSRLQPCQLSAWFVGLQLLPAAGFLALWQWDRRRRYLEAHPEVVRRSKARRALRHERALLQKAISAGDTTGFVRHAARAMSIAVAPHYPANPEALVGADVLVQFHNGERSADAIKQIFAAADAQYALTPEVKAGLFELRPEVEMVLQKLEERL